MEIPEEAYWKRLLNCQDACPVHTDARGYVRAIAFGEYERSYRIARGPDPLASICGRVCGAPCETACRRGAIDTPIAIRALKRFVCEQYGAETIPDHSLASGRLPAGKRLRGIPRVEIPTEGVNKRLPDPKLSVEKGYNEILAQREAGRCFRLRHKHHLRWGALRLMREPCGCVPHPLPETGFFEMTVENKRRR